MLSIISRCCSLVTTFLLWPYGLEPTRLLSPWISQTRILDSVTISFSSFQLKMKFPNIAHKALITVLDLPLQISVIQTLLPNGHHAFPDQGPSHMQFPQLEQQSPPSTQPLKSATI